MGGSIFQLALFALGGCVLGAGIGWSFHAVINKRRIGQLTVEAKKKLEQVTAERNNFADQCSESRARIERLEARNAQRSTELKTVLEKSKLLARNVRTLKAERENTKIKLGTIQDALSSLRQQTSTLQTEFVKSREFYKRELLKSLQKRKDLEEEIRIARADQESFAKAVESSVLEHGSEEDMVIAAQLRLGQLEVMERNVNKLEAENAQLRQDVKDIKRDYLAQESDLVELEELRLHNRQLVQAVEALEESRKGHEVDAERYRQQADESEKLSDTLRLKLDDLEKNFADMEKQQHEALEDVREAAVVPILRKQG